MWMLIWSCLCNLMVRNQKRRLMTTRCRPALGTCMFAVDLKRRLMIERRTKNPKDCCHWRPRYHGTCRGGGPRSWRMMMCRRRRTQRVPKLSLCVHLRLTPPG